jgi:hypothetical protein
VLKLLKKKLKFKRKEELVRIRRKKKRHIFELKSQNTKKLKFKKK